MRIAICDDSKEELDLISSYLKKYEDLHHISITYKTFHNGFDLISTAKLSGFTLYLLDVILPNYNGIEIAKDIRTCDSTAKIIFLTSSPEYALESYQVKASDYILKPVDEHRLFSLLDEHLHEIVQPQDGLTLKTKSGITRILYSKLSYVEVINKHVYFHLLDNNVYEITERLSTFEPLLLTKPEFIKVHRSYIVNVYTIHILTANALITHQGKNIPISRTLYKEVRDIYMEQMFT